MSTRSGAPFDDEIVADGRVLIYEGHNVYKNHTERDPEQEDQPRYTPSGALTDNGKFEKAAISFRENKQEAEIVRVYEKIKDGIWSFNGIFKLVDAYQKNREAEREAQLKKEREKLKKKEIKFNFTTPKKDWSIYGGWVNPFEPINKGRLGSTQEWRIQKPKRHYY